jgi:hypothetical protein
VALPFTITQTRPWDGGAQTEVATVAHGVDNEDGSAVVTPVASGAEVETTLAAVLAAIGEATSPGGWVTELVYADQE